MRAKILCVWCVLGLMFSFGTGSFSWADAPTVTPLGQNVQPATPIPVLPRSDVEVTPLGGSLQPVEPVDDTMEFAIERVLGDPETSYYSMDPVQARYVTTLFPDTEFCGVYFEQWPLQVEPPEGLAPSNVFYMNQGDPNLYYLTSPAELRTFFLENWPVVGAGANHGLLKDTAKTWLRLSQEFSQDGFYTFSKPVVEVVGTTAYGMVEVLEGGTGYIWVTITTGPTGSLTIVEDRHIHRGIRPL
jgi:hypothetical protein